MRNRPENWPELLDAHLRYWASQPFVWGKTDCVTFAAAWLTQLRYPPVFPEGINWDSPLSAYREFHSRGGFVSAIGARLDELGCDRIPLVRAQRGDLVVVRIDDRRLALGIANGKGVAVPTRDLGVSELPLIKRGVDAWAV